MSLHWEKIVVEQKVDEIWHKVGLRHRVIYNFQKIFKISPLFLTLKMKGRGNRKWSVARRRGISESFCLGVTYFLNTSSSKWCLLLFCVFIDSVRVVSATNKALVVVKDAELFPSRSGREEGYMDIWWIVHDGGLMLLMIFLLKQHKVWKRCQLRIFTIARIFSLIFHLWFYQKYYYRTIFINICS